MLPARSTGDEGFEVLRILPERALVLGGVSPRWTGTWAFVLELLGPNKTRQATRYRAGGCWCPRWQRFARSRSARSCERSSVTRSGCTLREYAEDAADRGAAVWGGGWRGRCEGGGGGAGVGWFEGGTRFPFAAHKNWNRFASELKRVSWQDPRILKRSLSPRLGGPGKGSLHCRRRYRCSAFDHLPRQTCIRVIGGLSVSIAGEGARHQPCGHRALVSTGESFSLSTRG